MEARAGSTSNASTTFCFDETDLMTMFTSQGIYYQVNEYVFIKQFWLAYLVSIYYFHSGFRCVANNNILEHKASFVLSVDSNTSILEEKQIIHFNKIFKLLYCYITSWNSCGPSTPSCLQIRCSSKIDITSVLLRAGIKTSAQTL